jgi:hypothetical protein
VADVCDAGDEIGHPDFAVRLQQAVERSEQALGDAAGEIVLAAGGVDEIELAVFALAAGEDGFTEPMPASTPAPPRSFCTQMGQ